ncbi:MAG: NUDIX hydrolase [Clostridiales bacterium]|jgi:ADP-ribose pyrophosphatase|nr:NUDIX hydrolase [Clostridiales bacterium]
MKLYEKTLEQTYVHKGKILNLRVDRAELPNGKECVREVVEHDGGVTIAALTDENELLFVRQYRYPYSEIVMELPAGKLERGENPFKAGVRELKEETGASASEYIDLGRYYPSPGYCGETIYMYGATGLSFSEQELDEDEFLEIEKIPLMKAVEMVLNNEIPDGKTQTAVLKMAMRVWYASGGAESEV